MHFHDGHFQQYLLIFQIVKIEILYEVMPDNEPLISVGILTAKQIEFELYGDFQSYGIRKTFSGRFTAELVNDKIVFRQAAERLEVSNEITFEPQGTQIRIFPGKECYHRE